MEARSFLSWQASDDGNSQLAQILLGINNLERGQRRIEEAIKLFDGGLDVYRGNFGNSDAGSEGNPESYSENDLGQRQITGQSFGKTGGVDDVHDVRRNGRKSMRYSLASFDEATNPRDSGFGTDSIFGKCLDSDWPSNLKRRGEADHFECDDIDGKSVRKAMARRRKGGTTSYTLRKASSVCAETPRTPQASYSYTLYALQPSGLFLLVKDWIMLLPLFNDLVVMPYVVAWKVDWAHKPQILFLAWLSSMLWTMDIGLNFVTGVVVNGEVMLSISTVSWHYLTHWFAFDAIVTLFDWICIGLAMTPGKRVYAQVQIVKILRWSRLCRDCRAAHLIKLFEICGWMHWNQSNLRRAIMTVLDLLLWISLGAHLLACVWFYMGACECLSWKVDGISWMDLPSGVKTTLSFHEEGHMKQYLASAQFIMALITLGSSDVLPQNGPERAFNIFMLMMGFFAGTTIVSMMSGYVVQYILSIQEQAHQVSKLRKFLNQNRIHQQLQMEIMSQASVRMRDEQIVREEDVPILQILPSTIRMKLMYETRLPILLAHPLFELWAAMEAEAILEFCTQAVTEKFHLPGDEVFLPGAVCEAAFVVMLGRLWYEQSPESSRSMVHTKISIPETHEPKDRWVCEAALWSHWIHVGTLVANTACQVMVINGDEMWRILLESYHDIGAATRGYCINFCHRLVAACPPHAVFPTDICIQPHLDRGELLNEQVGIGLLHQAMQRDKVRLTKEQYEEIKQELVSHKCCLQQPCDGVFQRIVAVEALLVVNGNNQYFIQIGQSDGSGQGVKAVCQYPAKKRTMDELPQDTLRRLLSEDLKPFDENIKIDTYVKEVEEKESKKLALPTTYNRTVHIASLMHSEDLLDLSVVQGSSEAPASLKSFLPRELYLVSSSVSHKLGFYVWMSENEFRRMKTESSLHALQAWLSSFATPCILNADI